MLITCNLARKWTRVRTRAAGAAVGAIMVVAAALVSAAPAGAAGSAGPAWTWSAPVSVGTGYAIRSLSCNVTCVGTDAVGNLIEWYAQEPLSTSWVPPGTAVDGWLFGSFGARFASAECSGEAQDDVFRCLAVGSGQIMQFDLSRTPTAEVVGPDPLPPNIGLHVVSCIPGGGTCIGGGFTSVAETYSFGGDLSEGANVSDWNVVARDLNDGLQEFEGVTTLDCPTASLCIGAYAIGFSTFSTVYDLVVGSGDLTDPSSWQFTGHDVGLTSCGSANLCGSYDPGEQQAEFTSTPTDPESWSFNTFVEPYFDAVSAVACTAQGSCLVGDTGGHIFSSSSPTTYGTPWPAQTVDPGNTITTISCTSDGAECVAGDSGGNVLIGTRSAADTTPPVIENTPADATVEAAGPSGATYTYTNPTASDDTDGSVPVGCEPASGSTFPLGDTTVTCTATDKAGNKATATFVVHVVDTTPPALTLPASPVVADATGPDGAAVTYTATATDLVDGAVTPSCAPASGSTFAIGDTTVTCTATDSHGNSSAPQSFVLHVRGAEQQLQDLSGDVAGVGSGSSLAGKVSAILQAIASGRATVACGTLRAFVNEVEAQSGKSISTTQAADLIAVAQRIEAVIGC